RRAVSGGLDKTVRLWDLDAPAEPPPAVVKEPREVRQFPGHTSEVHRVAVSADGKRLLTGAGRDDGKVRLFDLKTGEKLLELTGHTGGRGAQGVAFLSGD